uniref:Secreted protein n=1 Tax=Steinernema glaseri TaxID=37863 RepID=A0A1I7Y8H7_9BILA
MLNQTINTLKWILFPELWEGYGARMIVAGGYAHTQRMIHSEVSDIRTVLPLIDIRLRLSHTTDDTSDFGRKACHIRSDITLSELKMRAITVVALIAVLAFFASSVTAESPDPEDYNFYFPILRLGTPCSSTTAAVGRTAQDFTAPCPLNAASESSPGSWSPYV